MEASEILSNWKVKRNQFFRMLDVIGAVSEMGDGLSADNATRANLVSAFSASEWTLRVSSAHGKYVHHALPT
jgi:hypothetical protein